MEYLKLSNDSQHFLGYLNAYSVGNNSVISYESMKALFDLLQSQLMDGVIKFQTRKQLSAITKALRLNYYHQVERILKEILSNDNLRFETIRRVMHLLCKHVLDCISGYRQKTYSPWKSMGIPSSNDLPSSITSPLLVKNILKINQIIANKLSTMSPILVHFILVGK